MNKKGINLSETLTFFFTIPDWKERVLLIGGPTTISSFIFFVSSFFIAIPFIGCIIAFFLILIALPILLLHTCFLQGYNLEIIKAHSTNKDISKIRVFENFRKRIVEGFSFLLGNLVYSLPIALCYIIGFALIFSPMIFAPSVPENNDTIGASYAFGSLIIIFIGIIPFAISAFYQMVYQYVLTPGLYYLYNKNKKIEDMLKFKKLWKFIKENFTNIAILAGITVAINFIWGLIFSMSWLLTIVCIGVITTPVLIAFFMAYNLHTKAYLLGQIIRAAE